MNSKPFWKYINSKTKSRGKIVELVNSEGESVTDDYGKAQLLNNYFASVFTVEKDGDIPSIDRDLSHVEIIENIQVSEQKMVKHLLNLNISKAAGPDGLNCRVLKELANEIAPALKLLFDKSMQEGTLPSQWKQANVVALFKKGSKKSPSNYRPVSLTAVCCKVFEKIIRDCIVDKLEAQGLIHTDQHGFRGGRSCNTQLLEIMEIWTKWMDLGIPWDVVYTDFSKAFDSVPHKRLLSKLYSYGIRGNLLNWIENFLSDRKQRVALGKHMSEWKPVTSGIPQGSVLGPILFVIFINDMPDTIASFKTLFADDAKIFKAIESLNDITIIQDDICKLMQWSIKWQLPFNVSKCKVMHYGKKNPNHVYSMNNLQLASDTEEKDLGVIFDTSMTFKTHIRKMISKANARIGFIKRSFSKLKCHSFKIIYKSLIRPILEYCSSIWFPLYKGDSLEIEKVQRRATKLVPELKDLPYDQRLKKLNLTTLAYRRRRSDVLQVYRIVNNIDNLDFNMFFKRNVHPTRGHSCKLEKPRASSSIRQNCFSNRVINVWNSLPDSVVNSPSINSFKNALEKYWLHDPSKYDICFS